MKSLYHTANEYAIHSAPGERQFFLQYAASPAAYGKQNAPQISLAAAQVCCFLSDTETPKFTPNRCVKRGCRAKMFLYSRHLGKVSTLFASAAPAVLPASCATENQFLRFYRGVNPCRHAVYKFKFLHYIYSFSGFVCIVFTPCISCVSFEDRYFVLLFRFAAFSMYPHRLFVFRSVFQPSRRGRFAFPRCVSPDGLALSFGLCACPVRFHSSHFSFPRTQTVRHLPLYAACSPAIPQGFYNFAPEALSCFPAAKHGSSFQPSPLFINALSR